MRQLEGHADLSYDGDLNAVHLQMLELGGMAQDQMRLALQAIVESDKAIAQRVIDREPQVDELEKNINRVILNLIGTRGPISKDLRIIMAFSKAVADFERIGDEAARIAEQVWQLYRDDYRNPSKKLIRYTKKMGQHVMELLESSLVCFDVLDIEHGVTIINTADDVDDVFEEMLRRLSTFVLEDPRNLGHVISLTLIARSFERVGQHALNLAEYVVCLVGGAELIQQHRNPSSLNTGTGER